MSIFNWFRREGTAWAKTIAVVEPSRLKNLGLTGAAGAPTPVAGNNISHDTFKIRLAHDASRRAEAKFLVEKQYGKKGYATSPGSESKQACPESVTFASYKDDLMVGTLTVNFDVGNGLLGDALYKAEVDQLRQQGRRVCEFTKLAIDNKRSSKRLIAGLFHVGLLCAERVWGYTDFIIEVNPSHVGFYHRLMGFEIIGEERYCPRVQAPAVLLRLEASKFREMVDHYAGRLDMSKTERTLYPYFLLPEQEKKIVARFLQE